MVETLLQVRAVYDAATLSSGGKSDKAMQELVDLYMKRMFPPMVESRASAKEEAKKTLQRWAGTIDHLRVRPLGSEFRPPSWKAPVHPTSPSTQEATGRALARRVHRRLE